MWAYSNSMTTKVFKEKTRGKFVLEDKIGQKHQLGAGLTY